MNKVLKQRKMYYHAKSHEMAQHFELKQQQQP